MVTYAHLEVKELNKVIHCSGFSGCNATQRQDYSKVPLMPEHFQTSSGTLYHSCL